MGKRATVTIVLNYDLDHPEYDTMSENEIHDDIENLVYEDLPDLMRGDRLKYWAEVTIDNN